MDTTGCPVVRAGRTYLGENGRPRAAGIFTETAGSRRLSLQTVVLPPGMRGTAHRHEHESAVYVIAGEAELWSGDELEQHVVVSAGDFVYTPPGVPHLPANRSEEADLVLVLARTEATEHESLVPMPELDVLAIRPHPAPDMTAR